MSSVALPLQFLSSEILLDDYQVAAVLAEATNDQRVREYQTKVENWLVNREKLGVILPVPKPGTKYIVNEPVNGEVTSQFGPDLVCGEDPRIASALAPPAPIPSSSPVIVGLERGGSPGTYFAFNSAGVYDVHPDGFEYPHPQYGDLVRVVQRPEPFAPLGRNYWKKKEG